MARTNALAPDLVVLLGDFVHGGHRGVAVPPEPIAASLGRLRARLGVYAVLGNHDWWFSAPRMRQALRSQGITVLENQARRLEAPGGAFWVAELADVLEGGPDVTRALAEVPAGAPVLLLVHEPDIFPALPARITLTLAGHTHGGQVRFPFVGAPVIPSRYGQRFAAGLLREEGRSLFVTTGLGTSILPVRFRVPPEIALLRLQPG